MPAAARAARRMELWLLVFAMLLVSAYLAAVEANMLGEVSGDFWAPAGVLTLVFVGLHIVIRLRAPFADPVLMPAVALLNGLGVAFLRRLDLGRVKAADRADLAVFSGDSGRQLLWTLIAVAGAAVALWVVRDHREVSKYAWTLGLAGIVLVLLPAMLPSSISEVNGAKLWIKFGRLFAIQPGEFAKLALLVFFAYYLVRKREVLALASRRVLGIDFPARGATSAPCSSCG
jgi:cell division protein FtsW (lipid II flippase)